MFRNIQKKELRATCTVLLYHVSFRVGHDVCEHAGYGSVEAPVAAQLTQTPLFVPFRTGYGEPNGEC